MRLPRRRRAVRLVVELAGLPEPRAARSIVLAILRLVVKKFPGARAALYWRKQLRSLWQFEVSGYGIGNPSECGSIFSAQVVRSG